MKYRFMTMAVCLSAMLVACNDEDDEYMGPTGEPELIEKDEPTYNTYNEQFRPQIHYTPARNWTNDPNGMVYADGVWHLFYQYNPWGHDWGNMSWGHATSTDLMHWKEQPVALYADELGYIYSGSAVVDEKNVAGFGEGAIIAFYTSHGAHEQQSLAYSTDGGMTFTKYDKNPIVKNTTYGDYRDPKVVWDEEAQTWYMVVATGGDHGVAILRSTDLKTWRSTTVFHAGAYPKCNEGVWECPDLFTMDYKGEKVWVLTVGVSGGGPVLGSGKMYFVGKMTNGRFVADKYDYPLWEEHGMDSYAGVTWSGTGLRRVTLAWMNNQAYSGAYPVSPWRSAMTLPRDLTLVEYNGTPLLRSTIVPEIENLAEEWMDVTASSLPVKDAYQLNIPVDLSSAAKDCVIKLGNAHGQEFGIKVDAQSRELVLSRTAKSGRYEFSSNFAIPDMRSPLYTDADNTELCIYVDRSSVEITTADGSVVMTTLVFPESIYDEVYVSGQDVTPRFRNLRRVWD